MKFNALLAAVFVAGLAASIAFAAPRSDGGGTTATGTTATTTGGHGKHEDGDDGDKGKAKRPHCREVELKGTLANGTLSVSVDKANKLGATLGSSVTVAYGGRVKLHARLCQAANSNSVLQLRELKVQGGAADSTTTTTTTTTTSQ
jgi:hypothetical protein